MECHRKFDNHLDKEFSISRMFEFNKLGCLSKMNLSTCKVWNNHSSLVLLNSRQYHSPDDHRHIMFDFQFTTLFKRFEHRMQYYFLAGH